MQDLENKANVKKKTLKTFEINWSQDQEFRIEIEAESLDDALEIWWGRLTGMETPYIRTTLAGDELVGGVEMTNCNVRSQEAREICGATVATVEEEDAQC